MQQPINPAADNTSGRARSCSAPMPSQTLEVRIQRRISIHPAGELVRRKAKRRR